MADVAQLVRALDCGSGGRGFETHHSPQRKHPGACLGVFFGTLYGLNARLGLWVRTARGSSQGNVTDELCSSA